MSENSFGFVIAMDVTADNKVSKSVSIPQRSGSIVSETMGEVMETKLSRGFGIWGVLSVSWNIVNIFGGMSYIFVVGFSAGGIPAIFYGL